MKITKDLLRRHGQGLCTEEEKKAVEEWLLASDEPEVKLRVFKDEESKKERIWSRVWQVLPSAGNRVNMWLLDKEPSEKTLGNSKAKNQEVFGKNKRFNKSRLAYLAAAIIIFTVGLSSYFLTNWFDGSDNALAANTYKTVKTNRGEKRTVTLSDGSKIRLNYETEIRAPITFKGSERIVYLTGHAHFDVTRDTKRPFIIYTEDSRTQVLGTSFDINTNRKGETEVIVTSGKVVFSEKNGANDVVTLKLNDRAILGLDNRITTGKVDASRLTAWKENKLIFDGETLEEIIQILEPWYDVEITIEREELMKEDFTLSLDNPPLSSVLEDISFAGGFKYKIQGNRIIIF